MAGFASEADMLAPLIRRMSSLIPRLPGRFHTLFEVQSAAGIPDLVMISFNDQEFARRRAQGLDPILDLPDVAVMTLLGASYAHAGETKPWTPAQLSRATGFTPNYLSSTALRRLEKQGHVRHVARGKWVASHSFIPIADHIISVETKRTDWRSGFWQAHKQAADYTWLVIDAVGSTRSIAKADKFLAGKVGLATLSINSELTIIVPAATREPSAVYRSVLMERAVALYLSGQISGPVNRVFGRDLRSTTGADPRFLDVAGC